MIGDTGKSASTRAAVAGVRARYESEPNTIQLILDEIGRLVREARIAIEAGDAATMGKLMLQNHDLLRQLAVSSPKLDRLVDAALKAGALGAKLSGGGRGGNMIALVTPQTHDQVEGALRAAGAARVFTTEVR